VGEIRLGAGVLPLRQRARGVVGVPRLILVTREMMKSNVRRALFAVFLAEVPLLKLPFQTAATKFYMAFKSYMLGPSCCSSLVYVC